MKTTPRMQTIISRIAARHALDLSTPEAHLRLEQPGFMPLVIENIGSNLLSVAHYYKQNGDTIADPDVVFFTGWKEWIPCEITQSLGTYRRVAQISEDGTSITRVKLKRLADLSRFCEMWARNIAAQNWLEASPEMEASPQFAPHPTDEIYAV